MGIDHEFTLDMGLNEQQRMIRRQAREFAQKEIAPILPKIEEEGKLPGEVMPFMKKIADAGLFGITVPPKYGGPGADYKSVVVVDEELTRFGGELMHIFTCMHNLTVGDTIDLFGTEEQKKRWLPDLVAGKRTGAGAYSEPDAATDIISLKMTATKDGDGYLLNGTKNYVSVANTANTWITFARTKPEGGAHGLSCFVLEIAPPGVAPYDRPNKGKDGLQMVKHNKMGSRGEDCCIAYFDNYYVPAENMLGAENKGVKVMMTALGKQRPLAAASCVGHIWMALDAALPYAKERKQFGKPICEFQLIQSYLTDMYTMGLAARQMVHRAAELAWEAYHVREGKDTSLIHELNKVGSAAKYISSRGSRKAVLDAYQIHGGGAYDLDHPVNRILRDGLVGSQAGGTDEAMIINTAEELIRE